MKAEELEIDDSAYVEARAWLTLSDAYNKYIAWTNKKPFTRTQAEFANWLLEEPQASKLRQIGGLDEVFSDVRRFLKGRKSYSRKHGGGKTGISGEIE